MALNDYLDIHRGSMMCEHDLAEMETACADGACPICLASKLHQGRRDSFVAGYLAGIDCMDESDAEAEKTAYRLADEHVEALKND